jgi:hypothetical protein
MRGEFMWKARFNFNGVNTVCVLICVAMLIVSHSLVSAQQSTARSKAKSDRLHKHSRSTKARYKGTLCGPDIWVPQTAVPPNEVVVQVLIGIDGKVKTATAVYGDSALFEEAVNYVRKMTFAPAKLSGELVETQGRVNYVRNIPGTN